MDHQRFIASLEKLRACREAISWVKENEYNLDLAWMKCSKPMWHLWLLETLNILPEGLKEKCYCGCNTGDSAGNTKLRNKTLIAIHGAVDVETIKKALAALA